MVDRASAAGEDRSSRRSGSLTVAGGADTSHSDGRYGKSAVA